MTPEIKDKSLTECVMEDDALNIKRLLIPLKGEPNEEVGFLHENDVFLSLWFLQRSL